MESQTPKRRQSVRELWRLVALLGFSIVAIGAAHATDAQASGPREPAVHVDLQ